MHIHASYSQQLAVMGAARDEVNEIAARRAAEVRRRLAAPNHLLVGDEDEVVFVKAPPPTEPGPDAQAGAASDEDEGQPSAEKDVLPERARGSLFSARA